MGANQVTFSLIPLSDPIYVDGMPCTSCGERTKRTYYPSAIINTVRRAVIFDICPREHKEANR